MPPDLNGDLTNPDRINPKKIIIIPETFVNIALFWINSLPTNVAEVPIITNMIVKPKINNSVLPTASLLLEVTSSSRMIQL